MPRSRSPGFYTRCASTAFEAHRAALHSQSAGREQISAAWFGKRGAILELQELPEVVLVGRAVYAYMQMLALVVKRGVEVRADSVVLIVWGTKDVSAASLSFADQFLGQPLEVLGIEYIDTVAVSRLNVRGSVHGRACAMTER